MRKSSRKQCAIWIHSSSSNKRLKCSLNKVHNISMDINILAPHQGYFANLLLQLEGAAGKMRGSAAKLRWLRCVPPSQLPSTAPQFITPQLCWYSCLLLTAIFRLCLSRICVTVQLHKQPWGSKGAHQVQGMRREVQGEQGPVGHRLGSQCMQPGVVLLAACDEHPCLPTKQSAWHVLKAIHCMDHLWSTDVLSNSTAHLTPSRS